MKEEHIVISKRIGEGKPVRGSDTRPCGKCGEMVWVAPSSAKKIAEGYQLMCYHCAKEQVGGEENMLAVFENASPNEDQMKEIIRELFGV